MNSIILKCTAALLMLICLSNLALAQNHDLLTKKDYEIAFDAKGTVITSSGDGYNGTWFYYPASDRYIMWFDNNGLDPNRIGALDFWSNFNVIDSNTAISVKISYGWSGSNWPNNTPPLPADIPTLQLENDFLCNTQMQNMDIIRMGNSASIVQHEYIEISDYSPAWFYISINGKNVNINCQIYHASLKTSYNPPTNPAPGACCNFETGLCYMTDNGICVNSTYMGDGTTCADCVKNAIWDFGDAPASYGVLSSHNGARHIISKGIYLGQGVTREKDGQPSANASKDLDDGVKFVTKLTCSKNATVLIEASSPGVINGWIDWNRDGDWEDDTEQIFVDVPVIAGTSTLTFNVPASAQPGTSFSRIRFNTTGGLTHLGLANDGEVEDYAVIIHPKHENPVPTLLPKLPGETYVMPISQPVNLGSTENSLIKGWAVPSNYNTGPIIADNWTAPNAQPIEGFRWWGIFQNQSQSSMPAIIPTGFHIGIWSNNPTKPLPAKLIWETITHKWNWSYNGRIADSGTPAEAVFEFTTLLSQDNWFHTDTADTKYWISISAIYNPSQQISKPFLWVTRTNQDTPGAVKIQQIGNSKPGKVNQWPPVKGNIVQAGTAITNPDNISWDMAFQLISSGRTGGSSKCKRGDLNCDGVVDLKDVSILMSLWLD